MSQIASLSPTLRVTPLRSSRRATSVRVTAAASRPGAQKAQGPDRDPILEAVLREPVSFLGGIAAGFLALDVTQDPVSVWIAARSAEAGLAYQAAKERLEQQKRDRAP